MLCVEGAPEPVRAEDVEASVSDERRAARTEGLCQYLEQQGRSAAVARCLSGGMKATVMYGAGDVRIENVPDAKLMEATDALVRMSRACICGSDLWPYTQMTEDDPS